jgi:hypothetical protein
MSDVVAGPVRQREEDGFLHAINTRYHKVAMWTFAAIVVAHWAEHVIQAIQVYALGWARPDARGVLGLQFPWLVTTEWLHFGYAVAMLIGLIVLRPAMLGKARLWWNIALGIQIWHFVEHLLLWGQAMAGANLFGKPVPTSIIQLAMPMLRVELHLAYNALVTVPMLIAMYYHRHPTEEDMPRVQCTCAVAHAA